MYDREKYKGKVSEHLLDGLCNYGQHRQMVGDFLTAVLQNDLMVAMGRADDLSRLELFEICRFVYNEMPSQCWGSKEIVRKWLTGCEGDEMKGGSEQKATDVAISAS